MRLLLVLAAVLAFSSALAREQFLVESELWIDGQLRGTPVMVVDAGQPAMMSHLDDQEWVNHDTWRLEVEVEPDSDRLSPVQTYWVSVAIQHLVDGHWEYLADSIMGVPEGEPATLSVVDDGQEPTPESARLYLRLRTSRLRETD